MRRVGADPAVSAEFCIASWRKGWGEDDGFEENERFNRSAHDFGEAQSERLQLLQRYDDCAVRGSINRDGAEALFRCSFALVELHHGPFVARFGIGTCSM